MTLASNFKLKDAPKRSQLIEVLLGMAMPSRCNITHDVSFFDVSLNDSQKAAVRFALESVEVACIHGPPGEWHLAKCIPALMCVQVPERHTRSSKSYGNLLLSLLSIPDPDAY